LYRESHCGDDRLAHLCLEVEVIRVNHPWFSHGNRLFWSPAPMTKHFAKMPQGMFREWSLKTIRRSSGMNICFPKLCTSSGASWHAPKNSAWPGTRIYVWCHVLESNIVKIAIAKEWQNSGIKVGFHMTSAWTCRADGPWIWSSVATAEVVN
jgi:hypothetical protein